MSKTKKTLCVIGAAVLIPILIILIVIIIITIRMLLLSG